MTEVEQPAQNGIDFTEEDDNNKSRPADIEADMREMERRKRVEAIMSSRLFREELERIVDSQIREGGASGILQQLSDIVGVPAARVGSVFKSSNCVLPINDIRGVESMGYGKGEKILRCKLAATFRLLDLYGWTQGLGAQVTARLNADQELFLVNPFGLLFHEVTASSLNKADMQGNIVEHGTTNFGINANQYVLHSVVHAARPDVRCAIYVGCNPVVAVSSLKVGLLPLTKDSAVLGEIATHAYTGSLNEPEEREKLIRSLGPISKVLLLNNHGALCCGETIEEAFYAAYHIVQACETQLKLLPVGLDNLVLIPEEGRKAIYDASRKPPEGFEHKQDGQQQQQPDNKERIHSQKPKWRVGGAEFEALMRMLDNAGFRTGYIYRHPLVKSELPKPKNDVEVPPAVSSLGYLLEEEELYRQGVWKKSDLRKGGDRTRWLNSPNVYQKVEVLETGTPDPKKITKWVADGSPTHSTAVRIENALQFVPPGTNPKEFKKLQQLIKDNRRADKISAGPQSHILEGVTWDEANRIKDATVSATGDHVVLMGAASKGIIQRGYQHNATVYKAPYAKNPFDSVTDDELNEYKQTVERKRTHGEYTDTDFSESEALSSLQTSGAQQKSSAIRAPSQSETEDASEPRVLRIETKQAPKPSQPEVVLSDANVDFLNVEREHSTSKKPPTGRDENVEKIIELNEESNVVPKKNQNCLNLNANQSKSCDSIETIEYDTQTNFQKVLQQMRQTPSFKPNTNFYTLYFNETQDRSLLQNNLPNFDLPNLTDSENSRIFDRNQSDETSNELKFHADYESIYESAYGTGLESPSYNNILESVFESQTTFIFDAGKNSASSRSKVGRFCRPYRTVSHFGFNCPEFVSPLHKHVPCSPSKYIPLKREMTFDDLFSSSRYADVSEESFNSVLKRKSTDNFLQRNRRTFDEDSNFLDAKRVKRPTLADVLRPINCTELCGNSNRNKLQLNFGSKFNEMYGKFFELKSAMNSGLKTISEEAEASQNARRTMEYPTEGSNFIEKISKFTYSKESPNIDFAPVGGEIDSNIAISLPRPETPENSSTLEIPETPESQRISVVSPTSSGKRRLMTRAERDARKEEFFELWEDHLHFYTRQNSDDQIQSRPNRFSNRLNQKNTEENDEEGACGGEAEKKKSFEEEQNESNEFIQISVGDDLKCPENQKADYHAAIHSDRDGISLKNIKKSQKNTTDDEEVFNSIEKLILSKIESSDLIDPNEKIFNKIMTTIRSKSSPLKKKICSDLRAVSSDTKLISESTKSLETARSRFSSSTPDSKSSDSLTFFSLDISDVKLSDDRQSNIPEQNRFRQRIRIPSMTSTSSGSTECHSDRPLNRNKLSKAAKSVSHPNTPKLLRPISKNPAKKQQSPRKHEGFDIAVGMSNEVPVRKIKPSRKRNFIAENICNVSRTTPRRRQNVGAIFSINPFGKRNDNVQIHVQPTEKIYSFQTQQSATGSPRFWVTISPKKAPLPVTRRDAGAKKKITLPDRNNNKNNQQAVASSSEVTTTGSCSEAGSQNKMLADGVERCSGHLMTLGKQIDDITENFNQIVVLHENIEGVRQDMRENIAECLKESKITFSLSADED